MTGQCYVPLDLSDFLDQSFLVPEHRVVCCAADVTCSPNVPRTSPVVVQDGLASGYAVSSVRGREGERETEIKRVRQRETDRDKETEKETDRQTKIKMERDRESQAEIKRERGGRSRGRERQTEIKRRGREQG